MRKAKNIKVGDIIQFPLYEFQPFRSNWNGWIFRAAIVNSIRNSKKYPNKKILNITYCSRCAGRYQLLPNVEVEKDIYDDVAFEYNLEFHIKKTKEFLEYEKNGEQVCWDQDAALLLNHGFIK